MDSILNALGPLLLAAAVQLQNAPAPSAPAPETAATTRTAMQSAVRSNPVDGCKTSSTCLATAKGKASTYCKETREELSCPGKEPYVLMRSNADPATIPPDPLARLDK